jgi:hypothetical protein
LTLEVSKLAAWIGRDKDVVSSHSLLILDCQTIYDYPDVSSNTSHLATLTSNGQYRQITSGNIPSRRAASAVLDRTICPVVRPR